MNLDGKRVAYWLNELEPHPTIKGLFRVCLATEGEPGYHVMGDESKGQAPWYWDKDTCVEQNKRLGNTPIDAARIIGSSMAAQRGLGRSATRQRRRS